LCSARTEIPCSRCAALAGTPRAHARRAASRDLVLDATRLTTLRCLYWTRCTSSWPHMVSTRPVGSRRNLDPFDCGEPARPERDRGEIDRTVQLQTMDWRAGQPARSCHGRIPSAIWALDLLGGSRRVERGAARFFDVFGGNLAAPPAAGPAAIRSPGLPPSNGNFS